MAAVHGLQLRAGGRGGRHRLRPRVPEQPRRIARWPRCGRRSRARPWLREHYELGEKFIRTRDGRIDFRFAGLRRNIESIKSTSRIRLLWVDEAEPVSEQAWQKAIPTVREENAEIWVTWNPERRASATNRRFRETPPEHSKIVEVNWRDNPWFPRTLDMIRREDEAAPARAVRAYLGRGVCDRVRRGLLRRGAP